MKVKKHLKGLWLFFPLAINVLIATSGLWKLFPGAGITSLNSQVTGKVGSQNFIGPQNAGQSTLLFIDTEWECWCHILAFLFLHNNKVVYILFR